MRIQDLDALCGLARDASDLRTFVAELLLDPPASSADLAGPAVQDEDWLVLSTVHSAKGLEWQAVHLVAAYDGNFPSDLAAGSRESLAEERRLLYVAVTRARRSLTVYVPRRYYHRKTGATATATARPRAFSAPPREHAVTSCTWPTTLPAWRLQPQPGADGSRSPSTTSSPESRSDIPGSLRPPRYWAH